MLQVYSELNGDAYLSKSYATAQDVLVWNQVGPTTQIPEDSFWNQKQTAIREAMEKMNGRGENSAGYTD